MVPPQGTQVMFQCGANPRATTWGPTAQSDVWSVLNHAAATKVKVHGENFYRHSKEGGRNYPEWLAKTNKWTKHEFLRSWKRVEMFDAAVEKGVNPRKALGDLLKGENGDRRWIPTG